MIDAHDPCWIVGARDGRTNYLSGVVHHAVTLAFSACWRKREAITRTGRPSPRCCALRLSCTHEEHPAHRT